MFRFNEIHTKKTHRHSFRSVLWALFIIARGFCEWILCHYHRFTALLLSLCRFIGKLKLKLRATRQKFANFQRFSKNWSFFRKISTRKMTLMHTFSAHSKDSGGKKYKVEGITSQLQNSFGGNFGNSSISLWIIYTFSLTIAVSRAAAKYLSQHNTTQNETKFIRLSSVTL